MKTVWGKSALLLGAVVLAVGCGGDDTTTDDMGNTVLNVACTANQKTCYDNHTAFVCNSDGKALVAVQCQFGEKCEAGECKADPNVACTPADDGCMDATTALRCNASGAGFGVVACPTGTQCVGAGVCQGACVVGSSICLDNGHVATCNDGKSFASTACSASEQCVTTGQDPYPTAACKAAECKPAANGCDLVCGNKADPGAANQATTMSTCVETPNGYKWLAIQCPGVTSCNPTAGSCNNGAGTQADCTSDCTPGDSRCVGFLGYQTCGADGKWSTTTTACNTDVNAGQYICFSAPGSNNKVLCGDIACADGNTGACDDAGKFHACGDDGKVAADGTACAAGLCVSDNGGAPGKWRAGRCQVQCTAGDEQCIGGSTYVTCNNGLWGPPQLCAMGANCQQTTVGGAPRKVCGECVPGTHECGGVNGRQIRVCKNDATWDVYADCGVGTCQSPPGGAICVAECFPGKKVCIGAGATVPGVGVQATDTESVCSAEGRLPTTGTTCTAGTYCRRGPGANGNQGSALGCLTCVGTQNEYGLRDTKCSSDDGTANSGNYLTVCKADSSGWDDANNTMCVAPNSTCQPASNFISIPSTYGAYCHSNWWGLSSESNLLARFGQTCVNWFENSSQAPVQCALPGGGQINDCCGGECYADEQPFAASCVNPGL